jgi:hypothetical protein
MVARDAIEYIKQVPTLSRIFRSATANCPRIEVKAQSGRGIAISPRLHSTIFIEFPRHWHLRFFRLKSSKLCTQHDTTDDEEILQFEERLATSLRRDGQC